MSLSELIIDIPAEYEMNVFGQFDTYIKKIERTLHVTIISRDSQIKIIGGEVAAKRAKKVFEQLFKLSLRGNEITEQNVDYALSLSFEDNEQAIVELDDDITHHIKDVNTDQPCFVNRLVKIQDFLLLQ